MQTVWLEAPGISGLCTTSRNLNRILTSLQSPKPESRTTSLEIQLERSRIGIELSRHLIVNTTVAIMISLTNIILIVLIRFRPLNLEAEVPSVGLWASRVRAQGNMWVVP